MRWYGQVQLSIIVAQKRYNQPRNGEVVYEEDLSNKSNLQKKTRDYKTDMMMRTSRKEEDAFKEVFLKSDWFRLGRNETKIDVTIK